MAAVKEAARDQGLRGAMAFRPVMATAGVEVMEAEGEAMAQVTTRRIGATATRTGTPTSQARVTMAEVALLGPMEQVGSTGYQPDITRVRRE